MAGRTRVATTRRRRKVRALPLPFASPDRLLASFQRTGDPRALGRLFDKTAPELLRVAAWLAGNRADAEDLLQRTFLTVLTRGGNYDPARRALPWLCGVLGNHARKLHEQRQAREIDTRREREPDPLAAAAGAEFEATVARLRAELGAPYAEVLDLHLGDGLDCNTIAARLGRPAGTVRTQLMRGLQRLREVLPRGFVGGAAVALAANAKAQAVVLANVRAHVVGAATLAGTAATATLGGVLMAKKVLVLVPLVALLVGVGTWSLMQGERDHAPTQPNEVAPAAAQIPASAPTPNTATASAPTRAAREAVATTDAIPPDPDFATLVVHATWSNDGTPSANIGVLAAPRPYSELTERIGLTDVSGSVVLRRLPPGSCQVSTSFAKASTVELPAGAVTTVAIEAKSDGTISGTVVDDLQRPIADARLWASIDGPGIRGAEVGRSDEQGRFRLPFRTSQWLGARKAGRAPSNLLLLREATNNVTLVMQGAGGVVNGRVVDDGGRAVPGALVAIGLGGERLGQSSSMARMEIRATAARLMADAEGRFSCDGVTLGAAAASAWAPGFGPVTLPIDVRAAEPSSIVLALPRGAVVEGTVRDTRGRIVANAQVERVGTLYDFARPRTRTDASGAFRLVDLPAGELELFALADGKVTATVTTTAGRTTTWDPVLPALARLRGRVVDPDGVPLPGLRVGVARPDAMRTDPAGTTDRGGGFVIAGVAAGSVTLRVDNDIATLASRDVAVGDAPITITLTAAELPTAHLRGRVVDATGNPLTAVLILRLPDWRSCGPTECGRDGTFVRGPLPAGRYLASVAADGFGTRVLDTVPVGVGEDKVLPDIVLARAGRVELDLRGGQAPHLRIANEDGSDVTSLLPGAGRPTTELPPGNYVAIANTGAMRATTAFVVQSERTTTVELTLAPANAVTLSCAVAQPARDDTLQIVVRDAAGALVDCTLLHIAIEPASWRTSLPPGRYTATTRWNEGAAASTTFTVVASDAAQTFALQPSPR